jgi:hypothetical protein
LYVCPLSFAPQSHPCALSWTKQANNKQHKTLDIITLFHKPSLPSSTRVLNLLRTASANASEAANATIDQASDTTPSGSGSSVADGPLRDDFEIEVTESLPTPDQLSTIIDYLGSKGVKAGAVVQGAASKDDALKKLSESGFARPIVRLSLCPLDINSYRYGFTNWFGLMIGCRLE